MPLPTRKNCITLTRVSNHPQKSQTFLSGILPFKQTPSVFHQCDRDKERSWLIFLSTFSLSSSSLNVKNFEARAKYKVLCSILSFSCMYYFLETDMHYYIEPCLNDIYNAIADNSQKMKTSNTFQLPFNVCFFPKDLKVFQYSLSSFQFFYFGHYV